MRKALTVSAKYWRKKTVSIRGRALTDI